VELWRWWRFPWGTLCRTAEECARVLQHEGVQVTMSTTLESLEALGEAVQRATEDDTLRQLNFHSLPAFYCQELLEQNDPASPRRDRGRATTVPRTLDEATTARTGGKLAFSENTEFLLRVTLGDPRSGRYQPIVLRRSRLRSSEELEAFAWLETHSQTRSLAFIPERSTQAASKGPSSVEHGTETEGCLVLQLTGPAGAQHVFMGWSSDWMQNTAVFHADRFDELDMLVNVFWKNPEQGSFSDRAEAPGRFIGRAAVLASEMNELKGTLRRPLVNDAHIVIGEFCCEYCVIKPYSGVLPPKFSQLRFDLVDSVKPQRKVQLVGHRGAGSQKTRSRVQENTVLSFLTAIRKGTVDAIELDVQLTHDQVPVIYHDFFIRCADDDVGESDDERFQAAAGNSSSRFLHRAGPSVVSKGEESMQWPSPSNEDNDSTQQAVPMNSARVRNDDALIAPYLDGDAHIYATERSPHPQDQQAARKLSRSLGDGPQSLAERVHHLDLVKSQQRDIRGVPIYSLTYEQFKSACGSVPRSRSRSSGLRLTSSSRHREQRLSEELLDFTRAAFSEGNLGYLERHFSDTGESRNDSNPVTMIRDNVLPSLRRVLDRVPEEVTLLVEIKYPTPELIRETSLPYPERNQFIDRILEVIFQKGSLKRRIVFLSFDPDTCLMIRKKQSVYPVCFLNAAGRSAMSENRDPRALSVLNGVAFAVWAGLHGMVLLCDLIFEEPGIVQVIHSAGLMVYCYGTCTADPDFCEQLIRWGVDGIIADRVGYIARSLNPLFLTEAITDPLMNP
jgi:glycerophosphoryl diester phosphodiesterase